ncbi:unnamed protein product, partial [Brugia timori]|uniref:EB domain-containing protein n=1 Tax=Brugia timori TaxID=42155 RepID=A0A0R3QBN2_9BILA
MRGFNNEYHKSLCKFRSEVPKLRENTASMDTFSEILSETQFAFPGGDCSNSRECLLDSVCRNNICECKEGLYTLRIGNTYNCVPGNPADAGFGDGHGGLVIGLHSADDSSVVPIPEPEEHNKQLGAKPGSEHRNGRPGSLPEAELEHKGTSISI